MTPLVFNDSLWKTSGHWEHYRENMFSVSSGAGNDDGPADSAALGRSLKPMNCPAHCLVYAAQTVRSTGRSVTVTLAVIRITLIGAQMQRKPWRRLSAQRHF